MPAPLADRKRRRKKLLTTAARRIAGRVDLDFRVLARRDTTTVVYLPDPDYGAVADAAIRSGVQKDARCIIVSLAGRPDQQIFTTTLRHLASVAGLAVPAIIIIRDTLPAPKDELVSQFCRQIAVAALDGSDRPDALGRSLGETS